MTPDEKKTLIKKLGAQSNKAFDSRYSVDNRKWFVEKIIDSLPWQSTAASKIEDDTNKVFADAGKLLKDKIKKGLPAGNLPKGWGIYDHLKSRTQIIYGMIAMHREFLDPANAGYFDFILERRFRPVQRMAFSVNPNDERNVFGYHDPTRGEKMKVNNHASSFWDGTHGTPPSRTMPFVLSAAGKADTKTADEKLFTKSDKANRNLFACDPVATILLMDGLLGAKKPEKLLQTLANLGSHYLKIDNPGGHFGASECDSSTAPDREPPSVRRIVGDRIGRSTTALSGVLRRGHPIRKLLGPYFRGREHADS